ncbi:MAG: aspartate aminotransferase family protein [Pseudomonadota bacterium]
MEGYDSHPLAREIVEEYMAKTPGSKARVERAARSLPGGDTRRVSFYSPYPVFMERGQGCRLYDYDGREYLDMQNNYTSLIHGHAHPGIEEAAMAQLRKGTVLGSASEIQYLHAEHLRGRVPALEMLRYTNCGTEATMFALRTARAYTGKTDIMKMDGGYHGGHEVALVNQIPDLGAEGPPRVYSEPYLPAGLLNHVKVAPFNDLAAAEQVISENKDTLAAVIMEPVMGAGGGVAPEPGYLKGMRELTQKYGVLLILDEILTLRLGYGGVQELEEIDPDLTALGKIIGGGFPVGAFGGRREIMDLYNPNRERPIFHSGTFTGNNITLTAGLVALELYTRSEVARLGALGDSMRAGFNKVLQKAGLKGQANGLGSLVLVHWGNDQPPRNSKQAIMSFLRAGELTGLLHLEMLNRGVHGAPRGLYCLSTPMTAKEISQAVEAFEGAIEKLAPYVAEKLPYLTVT